MKFVTPTEVEYFRKRYPHDQNALNYALRCADEYADTHAPNALPSIKSAIAQLHFRYSMQDDVGERELIRVAVDQLMELGRAINDCAQS